jgi:hypothetical protein
MESMQTREQQIYWLILAKIELQRALCHFGQGQPHTDTTVRQQAYGRMCEHMLRAFACLYVFSPKARQFRTFRQLTRHRLMMIGGTDQLEYLRFQTYTHSRKMQLSDAFQEMDRLFDEAIRFAPILSAYM